MESTKAPALALEQQDSFALARHAAQRVIKKRFRVLRLIRRAYAKLYRREQVLQKVAQDLATLIRLARHWVGRDYRAVPWTSMIYTLAALIYFVNPADLIPDVLAGLGFVDDTAVITAVVHALRKDLVRFRAWERSHLLQRSEALQPHS